MKIKYKLETILFQPFYINEQLSKDQHTIYKKPMHLKKKIR